MTYNLGRYGNVKTSGDLSKDDQWKIKKLALIDDELKSLREHLLSPGEPLSLTELVRVYNRLKELQELRRYI